MSGTPEKLLQPRPHTAHKEVMMMMMYASSVCAWMMRCTSNCSRAQQQHHPLKLYSKPEVAVQRGCREPASRGAAAAMARLSIPLPNGYSLHCTA